MSATDADHGWLLGRVGGIPVYLAKSWVVIAVVIIVTFGSRFGLRPPVGYAVAAAYAILLLISIRMVFPTPERNLAEPMTHDEPFIVPLAVPYIAGPSLLAVIVVLVSQDADNWPWFLGGLVAAWLVTAVTLYFSGFLQRVVGTRALVAVERLMGLILVAMAVQMMFDGTKAFFVA